MVGQPTNLKVGLKVRAALHSSAVKQTRTRHVPQWII